MTVYILKQRNGVELDHFTGVEQIPRVGELIELHSRLYEVADVTHTLRDSGKSDVKIIVEDY